MYTLASSSLLAVRDEMTLEAYEEIVLWSEKSSSLDEWLSVSREDVVVAE